MLWDVSGMNHWIPYGFGTRVNVTWGDTCIMRQTLGKTHPICSLSHIHSRITRSVTQHLCRWQQHVTLSKVWTVLRLKSLSCPYTGKAGCPDSDLSPLWKIPPSGPEGMVACLLAWKIDFNSMAGKVEENRVSRGSSKLWQKMSQHISKSWWKRKCQIRFLHPLTELCYQASPIGRTSAKGNSFSEKEVGHRGSYLYPLAARRTALSSRKCSPCTPSLLPVAWKRCHPLSRSCKLFVAKRMSLPVYVGKCHFTCHGDRSWLFEL